MLELLATTLNQLTLVEEATNNAEKLYELYPENVAYETNFDITYRAEFKLLMKAIRIIQTITNNEVDFQTAKEMVLVYRDRLLEILNK